MNANQFESEKSVKSFDSLEVSNAVNTSKLIVHAKISLPLNIVAALILICGVVLPAQAEGDDGEDAAPTQAGRAGLQSITTNKTNCYSMFYRNPCSGPDWLANRDNWKIAKANVDKFFNLNDQTIAELFDYKPDKCFQNTIDLDENTSLQVQRSLSRPVTVFAFVPSNKSLFNDIWAGEGVKGGFSLNKPPDTIWTGAKRKDEKEYWPIIKANLDKFIGMSSEEIKALLGPERCSSKPWNRIDYRIGDAGLTFYLKDGKVEKLRFKSNVYIPGT